MYVKFYEEFLDYNLTYLQIHIIGIVSMFDSCYMSNKMIAERTRSKNIGNISLSINNLIERGFLLSSVNKEYGNQRILTVTQATKDIISKCIDLPITENHNTITENRNTLMEKHNSYYENSECPITENRNPLLRKIVTKYNNIDNNIDNINIMDVQTSCTPSKNDNQNSTQLTVIQQEQPKQSKFIKPSPEEVISYMDERGAFDPRTEGEHFYDYYTSNGWKVGRNSMKDWKAAVRNWLKPKGGNTTIKKQEFKKYGNPYNHQESMEMIDRIMANIGN